MRNSVLRLGAAELLILLVNVTLIFGVGRIAKISGELGSAIRNLREVMQDKDEKKLTINNPRTDESPAPHSLGDLRVHKESIPIHGRGKVDSRFVSGYLRL